MSRLSRLHIWTKRSCWVFGLFTIWDYPCDWWERYQKWIVTRAHPYHLNLYRLPFSSIGGVSGGLRFVLDPGRFVISWQPLKLALHCPFSPVFGILQACPKSVIPLQEFVQEMDRAESLETAISAVQQAKRTYIFGHDFTACVESMTCCLKFLCRPSGILACRLSGHSEKLRIFSHQKLCLMWRFKVGSQLVQFWAAVEPRTSVLNSKLRRHVRETGTHHFMLHTLNSLAYHLGHD